MANHARIGPADGGTVVGAGAGGTLVETTGGGGLATGGAVPGRHCE